MVLTVEVSQRRPQLSLQDYVDGVVAGDRAVLGRAVTLLESRAPRHRLLAAELLTALMPRTGGALRVGLTGTPGVGKSTLIERLGLKLVGAGHRLAVLAIDPSSTRTGGSILGDKTRMTRLSNHPNAFVRPSPSAGTLGGVAARTREALLLMEAAGFDVVLIETVGVGQSETVVADMTDSFVVLLLSGAGDELQGIKRGLLERAEVLAVNKADGANAELAERAARRYRSAMHTLHPHDAPWMPPVLTCSGQTGAGLGDLWSAVERHRGWQRDAGVLQRRRQEQALRWMWDLVDDRLREALREHPRVAASLPSLERGVREGTLPPTAAADALLRSFLG